MNALERHLRDEINAAASRKLELYRQLGEAHDPRLVDEIARIDEYLNGPAQTFHLGMIADSRTGKLIALRDRAIGGAFAEMRAALHGRVRPIDVDVVVCSRGGHRIKTNQLYSFRENGRTRVRSWCTKCERERQREKYLARVERAATESSPVAA